MRSLAVINQKGGVGKTTTAVNLAAALADQNQRVCLIDLDPQAHASLHLGVTLSDSQPSTYELLVGDTPLSDVRVSVGERLTLVPAHINLAAVETELAGEVGREMILRDKLQADDQQYDYLILDCPPSLGILTLNALTAVDEVLLPLQPHYLALHGLSKLLRTIQVVASRLNPQLTLGGVVFCMYDTGTRLANEVVGDVEAFFADPGHSTLPWAHAHQFAAKIRRNIRLAEAPSFGQSIFDYSPQCPGAADYRALADELLTFHHQRTHFALQPAA